MKEKIANALKQALKEKRGLEIITLRQLLSSIHNEEIEKRRELKEEEINEIIFREIKKREEAMVLYEKGKRDDLAKKEREEIEILKKYLPKMLSEEEISEIVEKTINELSATPKDFGKIMGIVMTQVKGKADGQTVAGIVKQKLGLK